MKSKKNNRLKSKLPPTLTVNWQQLLDGAARLFSLPAALIMLVDEPYIEVFKASSNPDNPYEEGDRELLAGLYCEKTIQEGGECEINDALSEGWPVDNPDIELGLISYLGLPLYWPEGEVFGTLCVLGREERNFTAVEKEVFFQFKKVLEGDLLAFFQQQQLNEFLERSKKRHKKLLRSKKLLEQAEIIARVGGFEYDLKTEEIYWTDELLKIHGYEPPEKSNYVKKGHIKRSLDHYPGVAQDKVLKAFTKAVREGKPYDLEVPFNDKEGNDLWVKTVGRPQFNSRGEVEKVVGTLVDITSSKKVQDKLKERVKELNCLHKISQFLADNNMDLPEIMERTVEILPEYFRYPAAGLARIEFRGEEYHSKECKAEIFDEFQVPLKAREEVVGTLYFSYCNFNSQSTEQPAKNLTLLAKEKELLTTVSNELTYVIEKKDLEAQRKKDNRRLNSILNSLSANICVLNPEGEIIIVNQPWYDFARENEAEMKSVTPGVNYLTVCYEAKGEDKEEALKFAQGIEAVMEGETDFFELEYPCHSPDKKRWFVGRVTPHAGSDNEGRRVVVIAHENITVQKERQRQIQYLSFHDNLTGLYNSAFFEQELKRLDTKRQLPLTIMLADINGLEVINASYGRDKGDEALKQAAKLLQNSLRREDILARWGGDEFIFLLPKTDKERGQAIYERVKAQCELTSDDEIPLSLGLGYAVKRKSERKVREVIKEAEQDMQHNKLLESSSSKNKIIRNLLNILRTKSDETEEHAVRMINLAKKLGKRLNLSNHQLSDLALLASLHDIGKTFIPENILKKPGRLSDEEWIIMKKHPIKGAEIAAASEEFAGIAEAIRAHHEQWDGSGYPDGLKGEEIPYLARMISIIDTFDVMTSERVYKSAVSAEEALAEIKRCAGSQFDPELAEVFVEMMGE